MSQDVRWSKSAGFFDADGRPDLFVVDSLNRSKEIETPCFNDYREPDYCSPNNFSAASVDSYFTFGRLGWQDATLRSQIVAVSGNGLGVCFGDHAMDGELDVYVANDAPPNVLWSNDGKGVFENFAPKSGSAVNSNGTREAGMSVQFIT